MSTEQTLEEILRELRVTAAGHEHPRFTYYHRQFLDHLRKGDWVNSERLPEASRVRRQALDREWIERQDHAGTVRYRITERGLAELLKPRP